MRYSLSPLPYAYEALEPVISREIMQLHHDKHHAAYVTGANAALEKLEKYRAGELDIDVKATLRDLSFHVNGHLLHENFWQVMQPAQDSNLPTGDIATAITQSFGSYEAFTKQFTATAKTVEGSGWALLVASPEKELLTLSIEKHNLMNIAGYNVILSLDVWEHAYYLDYKNDRGAYVDQWWKIVNWNKVSELLGKY